MGVAMLAVVLADGVMATFAGSGSAPAVRECSRLWCPDDEAPAGHGGLELAQPAGRRLHRRPIGGRRPRSGRTCSTQLVALPFDADVTPSGARAVAAQIAVDLVARAGSARRAHRDGGLGGRSVGPRRPSAAGRVDRRSTRGEAFAVVVAGGPGPVRVQAPEEAVEEFIDAIADRLIRTPAAAMQGGGIFADMIPTSAPSADVAAWLDGLGASLGGGAVPGLRMTIPDAPDGGFEAVVQLRSQLDPSLVVDAAELWLSAVDSSWTVSASTRRRTSCSVCAACRGSGRRRRRCSTSPVPNQCC